MRGLGVTFSESLPRQTFRAVFQGDRRPRPSTAEALPWNCHALCRTRLTLMVVAITSTLTLSLHYWRFVLGFHEALEIYGH
jgi:hypothetical protein